MRQVPAGWYQVGHVDQLVPSRAMPISALGRDMVAWRSDTGSIQLMAAYCPHMGAHLGYGGSVIGDRLRCPFHGWQFSEKGGCTSVPYSSSVPRVRLRIYPIVVDQGRIITWYSNDGSDPSWRPYRWDTDDAVVRHLPERVHHEWLVHSSVIEMSENVADLAHFSSVHELEMRQWDVEEMGHRRCVVGRAEGSRDKECWEITVVYEGPALGSSHYKGACEMVQLSSVTPLGDDVVKLSFEFLLPSRDGARDQYLLGRLLARRMIKIIDDDVEIWEHKRYLGKPMLMPEERSVLEFRRWIGSM